MQKFYKFLIYITFFISCCFCARIAAPVSIFRRLLVLGVEPAYCAVTFLLLKGDSVLHSQRNGKSPNTDHGLIASSSDGARFAEAASSHLRQQGFGQGVGDLLAVLGGLLGCVSLRRIQTEQGIDGRHVHELEFDQAGAAGLG